mmetsp:Transcript_66350/g.158729  ORF Transcript_66350/g.158729 Transcript_66350/m.158729 type:complete len:932 (-) Transcript_66350:120-2915(-)
MADEDETVGSNRRKKKQEVLLSRDIVIRRLNHRQELDHSKHESPLVRLREIFEEAPDKDRFVGDTMFWKYFEDIDTKRVLHTNSVEYRNLRIMFFETLFYCILLAVFSGYAVQVQSHEVFYTRQEQLEYWRSCDSEGSNCQIREVQDITSFWEWTQNEFIPRAFTQYPATEEYPKGYPIIANISTVFPESGFGLHFSPRFVGEQRNNALLGTIRMRQIRVQKNAGCKVSKLFEHVYPDCYSTFAEDYQSTTEYWSRFVPTYLRDAFVYRDDMDTRQIELAGEMAGYPGGGFTIDFPLNRTESEILINDLRGNDWCDQATRAIIIELTTLNTNVNVITNSRILFEFGPTGSVIQSQESNAAQVFYFTPSLKAGAARNAFILQVVLLLFFVAYTTWILFLMYKTCNNFLGQSALDFIKKSTCGGKLKMIIGTFMHYFEYGWNIVDIMIIFSYFLHFGYRMSVYTKLNSMEEMAPDVLGHPEKFMPFSQVMVPLEMSNQVLSVLAMFMWVKLFKYLCVVSYFRILVRILEHCAHELFVYCLLLVVVFFGFAVSFFVGFGPQEENYSGLLDAFGVLFFKLLDGYDVDQRWFEPGTIIIMPLLFTIYIAIVYFVLLNVFMAIVLDVYATSHKLLRQVEDTGDEVKHNPMAIFLWTYFNELRGKLLVREEGDENLSSEEMSIRLELLPGLVRKKWIEKKRKMRQTANENFAGLELFPGEEALLGQADHVKITDWMMPSSRQAVETMTNQQAGERPLPIYDVPAALMKQEISKAQLQRLMDEDETLPLLLATNRAIDVIRAFKKPVAAGSTGGSDAFRRSSRTSKTSENFGEESFEEVRGLQGILYGRIDQLERIPPDAEVPDVPEIKQLTEEMSHAITDVRATFRIQLAQIIEATATLFEYLVDLTQGLDSVRNNHQAVLELVRENTAIQVANDHQM